MKLAVFSPVLAHALGIPRACVNVLAVTLRKAGLVTRKGRGRGGAEMTPTDMTNLLLAAMGGGHAKDAPDVVRRLREATSEPAPSDSNGSPLPTLPNLPPLNALHSLGEVLDAILLNYVAEGELIDEDSGLPITNMSLVVTFPHRVGYQAELWIDTGDDDWTIRYHRSHPDFDGEPRERWNEIARRLLDGQCDLTFKATVTSSTFYVLSEALGNSTRRRTAEQLRALLRPDA